MDRWRTEVSDDVETSVRCAMETEPETAKWIIHALDLLNVLGSEISRLVQASPAHASPGSRTCSAGTRVLIINCLIDHEHRRTFVESWNLAGSASMPIAAVIYQLSRPLERRRTILSFMQSNRPARAARALTDVVVGVLPAEHQGRYREEFSSELYELAAAGGSKWMQVAYAVRLLDRAWVLRAELRAHRRAPAAERARS